MAPVINDGPQYPPGSLQEFFFTGYSLVFSGVLARAARYATGSLGGGPRQNAVDVNRRSPDLRIFGIRDPCSPFTAGALPVDDLAADPSASGAVTGKELSYFSPFFGVTILY